MAAVRIGALATAAAGAIHFAVAGEHFHEWWVFGVFFLVLAVAQAVLAVRFWALPEARVAAMTAAVNLTTVLLWVASRTTGLPIGPEAGSPEAWGVTDGVCAALEVAAAVAAGWVVHRLREAGPVTWRPTRSLAVVTGIAAVAVVAASGVAVAAPGEPAGHGHDDDMTMTAGAGPGHEHGGSAGTDQGNGERHVMANLPDVSGATAEQTAAARALVTTLESDTRRYRDVAVATRAGYDVDAALKHWRQKHDGRQPGQIPALHVPQQQARTDGRLVDPAAPETLIYHRAADGTMTLIGVMFTAEHQQPPSSYQPFLRWHFHQKPAAAGSGATKPTGYMTHVWFVDPGSTADSLRYAFAMSPPKAQLLASPGANA
ncbi:hypothetical protein GCM10023145_18800 [Angustibacter luteus]